MSSLQVRLKLPDNPVFSAASLWRWVSVKWTISSCVIQPDKQMLHTIQKVGLPEEASQNNSVIFFVASGLPDIKSSMHEWDVDARMRGLTTIMWPKGKAQNFKVIMTQTFETGKQPMIIGVYSKERVVNITITNCHLTRHTLLDYELNRELGPDP